MIKFEHPINGRYYYLQIQRDLLHTDSLTIIRGGKYGRNIITSIGSFCDYSSLIDYIDKISKVRIAHGYLRVN